MSNILKTTENCQHSEADPPGTLETKVEELRATLDKALPLLSELEDSLPELSTDLREAVREELTAACKQPKDGGLLTKEDVADWLQVSLRTVDTLAASGELRKVKVRGCVRFTPGAVEAYIRQCAGEGVA